MRRNLWEETIGSKSVISALSAAAVLMSRPSERRTPRRTSKRRTPRRTSASRIPSYSEAAEKVENSEETFGDISAADWS